MIIYVNIEARGDTLILTSLRKNQAGNYACKCANKHGYSKSYFNIELLCKLKLNGELFEFIWFDWFRGVLVLCYKYARVLAKAILMKKCFFSFQLFMHKVVLVKLNAGLLVQWIPKGFLKKKLLGIHCNRFYSGNLSVSHMFSPTNYILDIHAVFRNVFLLLFSARIKNC